MKLLYLSCHEVLEYDEISLFNELGVQVFSPGAYVETRNRGDLCLRPDLPSLQYDPDDVAAWRHLCNTGGVDGKDRLSKEFVDRFDAVMIMHIPNWVSENWDAMRHKRVIWRTIGQAMPHQELKMQLFRSQGLKIVRYSPREYGLEHFAGSDAMIRFYKDPDFYGGWTGERKTAINFTQAMPQRGSNCNYELFKAVAKMVPMELYGPGNEAAGELNKGRVPFDKQKEILQNSGAYFYTGTHPASYTLNFIEALMTGIPIVAVGAYHGNADFHKRPTHPGADDYGCLYEIPDIIKSTVNGIVSDGVREIAHWLKVILEDSATAQKLSAAGRETAIKLFGKSTIKEQWRDFFSTL